jgi:uncharacterized protein (TIGR03435 family)
LSGVNGVHPGAFVVSLKSFLSAVSLGLLSLSTGFSQDKPVRLTYEIASVKASNPDAPDGEVDPLPNGTGYNATGLSVKDMLAVMYRMPRRQIVGGPEWLDSEKFDILARADHSYSIDELHEMFVNLLKDRFNLKLHLETKEGPVYVLTVAKTGLKMTPVDAGKDRHSPIHDDDNNVVTGDRVPMNYLCFWLGQILQNDHRPVIDRTGLTGTYDFTLAFRPVLPPDFPEDQFPEIANLPTIFQALRDQLGLELTPQKGPVEMLVIDHVEKPSAN